MSYESFKNRIQIIVSESKLDTSQTQFSIDGDIFTAIISDGTIIKGNQNSNKLSIKFLNK